MDGRAALACACAALVAALPAAGGEVRCASAESMAGLMAAWTRDFTARHADNPARITLREKFAANAFAAFGRGEVDVVPLSRELFPAERAAYVRLHGTDPLVVPVATGSRDTKGGTHAIAVFVHGRNPLPRISLDQLREVLAGGGAIRTWGDLGLTGEWSARRIVVHGMTVRRETGNPPGIVNFLEQRLLPGRAWRDDLEVHVDVPQGPQALELIVRAVAADEAALGYSGFAYAQPGARTLALGETAAGPFFAGTAEDVATRHYPLARTIYLCVRATPDEPTRAFVRHVLSAEGQLAVAGDAERFCPLPAAEREQAQGKLAP